MSASGVISVKERILIKIEIEELHLCASYMLPQLSLFIASCHFE